jgi:hypothetical protein
MRLGHPVGPLEDEGLGGMERAEIGGSSGIFAELDREYGPSVSKRLASLVEVPSGLGRHKSMPSRRISCISGERSR